ncbi:MAG: isochorismatase family protein [Lachnospiraceae bacterium]|nr:isochorismatase family protein [Lachnospiraceae bacterium]
MFYDCIKANNLCFEKNHSDSYTSKTFREHMERCKYSEVVLAGLDECGCVGATAKGAAKTGVKVKMLGECIVSRFPKKKVQKMREQLKSAGVEYI